MRPVRSHDVSRAAEVLLALPVEQRPGMAELLLRAAEKADIALGDAVAVPGFCGDGSLGGAASAWRRVAQTLPGDRALCDCKLLIFEALLRLRSATASS